MAVYFITGKLGSGKSLIAVSKIRDYLMAGRPIATNIDLNLKYLVGSRARKLRAYRLPDRPTSKDLLAIGRGNPTKDETQNGGIFLDECGIWFNSRNWNAAGRQDIINFMLMVRKMGWDVYFLVQNISVIDKQARDTLAEYVAYCVRLDRVHIPILSSIFKTVTGKPLPLPKMHHAVVKLGTSHNGVKSESWTYRGTDLYSAYNTQQIFLSDADDQAVYSYLPPIYYFRLPKFTAKNIMRLTRIYLRRYSRVKLVALSVLAGVALQHFWNVTDPSRFYGAATAATAKTATEPYRDYRIVGYTRLPGRAETYVFGNGADRITSGELIKQGVRVYSVDRCEAVLTDRDNNNRINLTCEGES